MKSAIRGHGRPSQGTGKKPSPGLRLNPRGFTLVEMLVVIAILAILAAVTVPYAEVTVKRDKELELKRDLREMRNAIDQFHTDWTNNVISKTDGSVSDDGYPKTILVLVDGVQSSGAKGGKVKYLRRVPENPFADPAQALDQQWAYHGYGDERDSTEWGGADVYDVYCPGDGKALDGSHYRDW